MPGCLAAANIFEKSIDRASFTRTVAEFGETRRTATLPLAEVQLARRFLNQDGSIHDPELDFGVGIQAETIPDVLGNRYLAALSYFHTLWYVC
jgi:hypothetical protein